MGVGFIGCSCSLCGRKLTPLCIVDKVVALDIVLFNGFDGNRCCCQTRQVHRVALQQYTIEPCVFCAFDATLMLYGFYT